MSNKLKTNNNISLPSDGVNSSLTKNKNNQERVGTLADTGADKQSMIQVQVKTEQPFYLSRHK